MASNGFWDDPCGFEEEDIDVDNEVSLEDLQESFDEAIHSVTTARRHVTQNFNIVSSKYTFIEMESIENVGYDFLKVPDIDKENTTKQSLLDAFLLIQKFAASLQVIIKESQDDKFKAFLIEIKEKMIQMLCSLERLLLDLKLQKTEKVTESVASDLTDLSKSERAIRDVVVMRDYRKAVAYVETVLKTLNDQPFVNSY